MLDKTNGVVSGNDCMVWLNGEILDDIKQFEWKVSLEFSENTFLNDPRTYKKYQGFTGEGTLQFNKTQSRGAKLLKDAIKTGIMPDVKIVSKMANPSTGKAERCVFSGIVFSEFGASAEAKTSSTEELPFSFSDIEFVELM